MKARASLYLPSVVLLAVLGLAVGCTKAPNDAQITSDVQNKINTDSGLQGKPVSVQTANGVVTLSGTVDNENQREAAARYASSVDGVKQVVNNLTVAAPTQTAQAPPEVEKPKPTPAARPRPTRTRHLPSSAPAEPTPAPVAQVTPAPAPAAAPTPSTPPPAPQKVTIPSGTTLSVRLVDTIDTETAVQGQTFHATLESPLAYEGDVVVPSGYNVEGHVVEVKSAGKFAGQSVLALQLDRLEVGSKYYSIQTDQYRREGSSRGKNTAAKVGTGAAVGAIIGAIAGGGKGAAIGAAAGGGLGGGIQAATKGQQIKLPSETVLNFTLQGPLTVLPAKSPNEGRQKMDDSR
jgi:hypothetical protein